MNVVILTGASRGLGAAMAARLLAPDCQLICISRKPNRALGEIGPAENGAPDWSPTAPGGPPAAPLWQAGSAAGRGFLKNRGEVIVPAVVTQGSPVLTFLRLHQNQFRLPPAVRAQGDAYTLHAKLCRIWLWSTHPSILPRFQHLST